MKGTVLTWSGVVLGIVATGGDQAGLLNAGLLVPAGLLFVWGVRRWRKGERTSPSPSQAPSLLVFSQ